MAGASFKIRAAAAGDAALLLTMIHELAEYEKLGVEVTATEETLREALFSERRAAEAMIGEYDGAPAAYMIFFHNFSTFSGRAGMYLEDVFIRPAYRGKGLGRRMMEQLARTAAERGCAHLEWLVLDWNEPAIGFYKSLGARAMEDWKVFRLTGSALAELAGS